MNKSWARTRDLFFLNFQMKNKLLLFACLITLSCCGQKKKVAAVQPLIQTEHGWKGKYLEGTRMKTEDGMYNIKFEELNFMGMIDRSEIDSIIQSNKGMVLDGDFGGLDMVIFKGVDSKKKNDSTVKAVLPQLEWWYAHGKH